MNSKNYKEEILGEFYISPAELGNKHLIIETINRFINSTPNLNPDGIALYHKSHRHHENIISFASNNSLLIIDYTYFIRNIHPFVNYANGSDLAIMLNPSTNEKRVYVKRTIYGDVKELSLSLSISTLQNLYHHFITDVVSPKLLLRERKEKISQVINSLCTNCYYYTFVTPTIVQIVKYNNVVVVDHLKPEITYNTKSVAIDLERLKKGASVVSPDVSVFYRINNIKGLDDILNIKQSQIQIDDLTPLFNQLKINYENEVKEQLMKIEKGREELEKIMKKFV